MTNNELKKPQSKSGTPVRSKEATPAPPSRNKSPMPKRKASPPSKRNQSPPAKRRGVKRARSATSKERSAKRVCTNNRRSKSASKSKSGSPEPARKLRIGILMTYPKLEVKKEELIKYHDKMRPWTKLADSEFVVQRKFRREKKIGSRHPLGKWAIPTDASIAYYLKHTYGDKNIEVDMIMPHEINEKRLKANDLNFLVIYDTLESFHTDKTPGKKLYNTLKKCLDSVDNIFPPKEYRELIESKIKYYNYLKDHNICICPTITMTSEEFKVLGAEKAVAKIVDHANEEDWPRFICKPVYGQEGIDAKFFQPTHKKRLQRYLESCMKKYPGVVIQKEIPNFGNSRKSPEIRMYYVGNQYQYSASAQYAIILRPREEGGTFDTPLESLKRRTRSILKRLPPCVMPNGKKLPRLLTRLDMGYIVDGKYSPFVNEVEFVPSLYSEDCAHHPDRLIDARLGDQMVKITKMYVK